MFGATGQVGSAFVEMALEAGHEVRALVRSRGRFKHAEHPNVFVVEGDATNPEDVREVVGSADTVVSCLGNPPGGRRNSILIMEKAADCIMEAAQAQPDPPRCLMISSVGVGGSSWFIKAMLSLIGGSAGFADYERAEARVRKETAVPFAVVRPYALNDKPGTGRFKVLGKTAHFARPIPRQDVARFFMTALDDTQWDGPSGVNIGGA
ncbi:MAG: SDR family oxidoreductase [Deltaproteobacteria bacterium]|nr:SDR family oxidoreductase [Deltaproteobacteria bacterium]